ncbi:MAG: amidohydrolase [Anaeromicrobium sp.]|uniref:amidohydrolase n=1 Tax=Anaeromicrobium sp. TaxID=1929132 RepID=UPI0025EB56BD|nr:amidohydrolase [Anaeromicrobium sp.]MCT4594789.1 amidohydrolase [Anaeromicrobium sp.]
MESYFDNMLEKQLIDDRRDFHKYAEVKWTEFRTSSVVAKRLMDLGYDVKLGLDICVKGVQFGYPDEEYMKFQEERAITQGADSELVKQMAGLPGVVGILDTGKKGPVTAFRFDMDALNNQEILESGHYPYEEGFASINEGFCHACGHDGHTSIGLGVAQVLMKMKDKLTGKIKLIFQPAEEGGGGAIGMVKKGILDDVEYFFAIHVGLTKLDGLPLKSHGIICGVNDFLDNRRIDVSYIGKAAHPCGDPHVGKNALLAACAATLNIHSIAPHSEGMLRINVGKLEGGVSRNTIAPTANFQLECRGENQIVADYGEDKVMAIIKGAASMYQVESHIDIVGCTPSATSDEKAIEMVYSVAQDVDWFKEYHRIGSVGGSDDASDMIRQVQKNGGIGTYIGLGADFASGFHHSAFDFDENVMLPSVELLVKLVEKLQK